MPITREQLAAEAPDVLAAVQTDAVTAERQRIKDVQAQLIPGHEAVIAQAIESGASAAEAAMAVNAAERASRTRHAAALAGDAPAPLPSAPVASVTPVAAKPLTKAEIDAQAKAHQAAHPGTSYLDAVKHVQAHAA